MVWLIECAQNTVRRKQKETGWGMCLHYCEGLVVPPKILGCMHQAPVFFPSAILVFPAAGVVLGSKLKFVKRPK
jgi:hypothetical protein